MDQEKKQELEAKLRRMLKLNDKSSTKPEATPSELDSGNIIRRRKGQKDKRISLLEPTPKWLNAES